jgi:hypothetical protein
VQHISGAALSPDATRLYVGLEECIMEYRVNTHARRSFGEGLIL